MAKIKFGMFMVDGRGKVGGSVFSKNRAGSYVRNKVTPSNPQTSAQLQARSRLSSLAQQFRTLTQPQIDAWNAAVNDYQSTNVFGDQVKKTGLNLFVALNSVRDILQLANLTSPPAPVEVPSTVVTISDPDATSLEIDLSSIPANTVYMIEATPPVSPGVNNVSNQFRLIKTLNGTGSNISGHSILTDYTNKFGTPVVGQKFGVRVKVAVGATGQTGLYSQDLAIIT
jgi:hypothetical protein